MNTSHLPQPSEFLSPSELVETVEAPSPPVNTLEADKSESVQFADMRAEFEELSRQVPYDPESERAFIESKIEIIRRDPHLSDADKERAIGQLRHL